MDSKNHDGLVDQSGEGIIGEFFKIVASKSFKGVANLVRKGIKRSRPLMDGEFHVWGANFMGPGTRIDLVKVQNTKPLNKPDAVARRHDLSYLEASKIEDKKEREEMIRKADIVMIKELKDMGKLEGDPEFYRQMGLKGIQFKKNIEDMTPKLARKLLPPKLIGRKILSKDIEKSGVLEKEEKEKEDTTIDDKMDGEGIASDLGKITKKIGKKLAKTKIGKKVVKKVKKISKSKDIKEFVKGFKGGAIKMQLGGSDDAEKIDDALSENKQVIMTATVKDIEKQPKSRLKRWASKAKQGLLTIAKGTGSILKDVVSLGFETVKQQAGIIGGAILSAYLMKKASEKGLPGFKQEQAPQEAPQEGQQEGGRRCQCGGRVALPQAVGRAGNPVAMRQREPQRMDGGMMMKIMHARKRNGRRKIMGHR